MVDVLNYLRPHVHGLVHCSGGAQTKVLHFVENVHVIKDNLFETPPLFRIIQEESGTDWKEMYTIYNPEERYKFLMRKSPELLQKIPLQHIASFLGMRRETLSRIRSKAARSF